MKLSCAILSAILVAVFPLGAPAEEGDQRTWTDNTGSFSFEGQFLRMRGNDVLLQSDGGKIRTVPMTRLSEEDREWLKGRTGAGVELSEVDPLTGIAWYSAVEPAFAEAKRSRRPIFFMAAATQCSGVSGVF